MKKYISMGPVVIQLQDFLLTNCLLNLWEWKLDSFYSDENHADVIISADLSEKQSYDGIVIEEEISGFFTKQVIEFNNSYIFRFYRSINDETLLAFKASKDFTKIALLEDNSDSARNLPFEYLSHVLPYSMLSCQVLTFHGVLMEYQGYGIIISAPSGTGKTTHARLWKKYENAFIINGDKASCYKKNGVWTGFGTPWCGTSGEYMNREVPIRAIVILERGDRNQVFSCEWFEGFRKILPHVLYPKWDEPAAEVSIDLIEKFSLEIPIYHLKCLPDKESVELLKQELFF